MKFLNHSLKLVFIAFITCMFALTACEGPDGPQGPKGADGADGADGVAGPAGPAGADGAMGTAGTNGTNGQDGNANVKSYKFSVATTDYDAAQNAELVVPAITQDIVDNGVVLVYWESTSGWRLLPFTFITTAGTTTRSLMSNYSLAKVTLSQRTLTSSGDTFLYTGQFRIVVIPGTAGKTTDNVNYSDYYEVARYYGLPLD